jgi:hypothetical protein
MNTTTTSSFTCALDGLSYTGGGLFADSKYWKVSGHPVMSYFIDEASYFGGNCTSAHPCAVYSDNQPGTTCISSTDCWTKLFAGINHHISNFLTSPFIIHRNTFTHAAPNNGSFRWFNPSTSQSYQNFGADPNTPSVDTKGFDGWLNDGTSNSALHTTLPVVLAAAYGKVDHSQSPFPDQSGLLGSGADHLIIDAQCGKTWLASLARPAAKGFGTSQQLQALEIATFDDYDEGTEMETGIDNCMSSLTAGLSGQTLSWSIAFTSPGDESTIDHYAVFNSTDGTVGENLTLLQNVAVTPANNGTYSLNLGSGLPSTAVIYVKAVGKSMLRNHTVDAGICTSCGSGDFSLSFTAIPPTNTSSVFTQYSVTVTPINGFTGTVNCTVSGLPAGASASCPSATIAGSPVTVQLTYRSIYGGDLADTADFNVQITYTAANGIAHTGSAPSAFPINPGVDD